MSGYLASTRDFLYRRRRPFIVVGSVVGGAYLAGRYAISALKEMQARMSEERRDKENLKRRFAQNQEDCNFTVLALLPTLGDQLRREMDVEELTKGLQKGRLSSQPAASVQSSAEPAGADASAAAEGEGAEVEVAPFVLANGHANAEEVPAAHVNGQEEAAPSTTAETSQLNPEAPAFEPAGAPATNGAAAGGADKALDAVQQALEQAALAKQEAGEGPSQSEAAVADAATELPRANGASYGAAANGAPEAASSEHVPSVIPASKSSNPLDSIGEPLPPPLPSDARLPATPDLSNASPADGRPQAAVDAPAAEASEPAALAPASEPEPAQPTEAELLEAKRAKLRLWNELKITAVSRTVTTVYCLALLMLQTSLQLNLIGRYAYLSSVVAMAPGAKKAQDGEQEPVVNESEGGLSQETERLYLTFSWWFLHKGWREIADLVREGVQDVFGSMPLKSQLSFADFKDLIDEVRRQVEYEPPRERGDGDGEGGMGASISSLKAADGEDGRSEIRSEASTLGRRGRGKRRHFLSALFPTSPEDEISVLVAAGALTEPAPSRLEEVSPELCALLDETKDIIESIDFRRMLKHSFKRVFETFEDTMRPAFGVPPPGQPLSALESRFQELSGEEDFEGKRIKLAALFPAIARQSQLAVNGVPNEYVETLTDSKELRAFSSIIYTAWT